MWAQEHEQVTATKNRGPVSSCSLYSTGNVVPSSLPPSSLKVQLCSRFLGAMDKYIPFSAMMMSVSS